MGSVPHYFGVCWGEGDWRACKWRCHQGAENPCLGAGTPTGTADADLGVDSTLGAV